MTAIEKKERDRLVRAKLLEWLQKPGRITTKQGIQEAIRAGAGTINIARICFNQTIRTMIDEGKAKRLYRGTYRVPVQLVR